MRLDSRGNEIAAALPDDGDGANDAEGGGGRDENLRGDGESATERRIEQDGSDVRERKHEAEIAEADAFQHGVRAAAEARGDKSAPPPGFEHGARAEAGASSARGKGSKKIGESAADEEEDGDPERDESTDGEESEEKIFDDAIAEDIELGAEGRGEAARAREVAVETVEGDGGDRKRDGDGIGDERIAEEGEERDGGECRGNAGERDLVGRHRRATS